MSGGSTSAFRQMAKHPPYVLEVRGAFTIPGLVTGAEQAKVRGGGILRDDLNKRIDARAKSRCRFSKNIATLRAHGACSRPRCADADGHSTAQGELSLEALRREVSGLHFDALREHVDGMSEAMLWSVVGEMKSRVVDDVEAARRALVQQPALAMAVYCPPCLPSDRSGQRSSRETAESSPTPGAGAAGADATGT